jgi:hypothetical protein
MTRSSIDSHSTIDNISGNNIQNSAIPDKHQIELVAKSPNDMGKQ